ncbi:MAG: DNA ligase [Hyphomicrobiales bacterium]|nr:DNA ligase [Hyphomicrobiales bacterium]
MRSRQPRQAPPSRPHRIVSLTLPRLDKPITPAKPILVRTPPTGPGWLHEIKHDGYRIVASRQGDRVRLWSRAGRDWSAALPGIRDAVLALPVGELVIDGEAAAHGEDGRPHFHGLRSRRGRLSALLFAFDLLRLDGEDLRELPLLKRKAQLESLLRGASDRLRYVEHLEGDGPTIFAHACALGLEGIVSKRADAPYGARLAWLKVKNPGYSRKNFRRT